MAPARGSAKQWGATGYFGRRNRFFGRAEGGEGKRSGEIGTSDMRSGGSATSLLDGGGSAGESPRISVAAGPDPPPESTESMSLTIAALSAKSTATFADGGCSAGGGGGGAGGGGADGGGGPQVGVGAPASTLRTRPSESSSRASTSQVWSSLIGLGGKSVVNWVSWQMRPRPRVLIPRCVRDPRSSVGHVGAPRRWYRCPDGLGAALLPRRASPTEFPSRGDGRESRG